MGAVSAARRELIDLIREEFGLRANLPAEVALSSVTNISSNSGEYPAWPGSFELFGCAEVQKNPSSRIDQHCGCGRSSCTAPTVRRL